MNDGVLLRLAARSVESEILPAADRVVAALVEAGCATARGAPRLKLALVELITNAMEHGNRFAPDREVSVTALLEGDRVVVVVRDQGPGPDPALLERDLDDVALESKRGRGLGIVRRIVGAPAARGERPGEVVVSFARERFA